MDAELPKFAVVGTGSMAAAMMSTFALAGVRVTAVASRDPERGRRFANAFAIPTAAEDLGALLRTDNVDAIYIANATADHARTAIAALQAGKAVLCEKPLVCSVDEAQRVTEAVRRSGRLCMEGLWTAFLPAYQRFQELGRSRACGLPIQLSADFGYPVDEKALPRLLSPTAGGVLLDRGVYLIALALNVFGPVEQIDAQIRASADGVDQHASLQLAHRGGGQSQLSVSFTALMSNSATLACSAGSISLEDPLIGAETVSICRAAPTPLSPEKGQTLGLKQRAVRRLRQQSFLRRLKRAFPGACREHLSYGADQYLPQLRHFIGRLRAGAIESDVLPLALSLDIQRVVEGARQRAMVSSPKGPAL